MVRTITALRLQKKNTNRVNVYLDGEFAFGVAKIIAARLKVGQQLGDKEITVLKEQDGLEVAYLRAIRFLGYAPRSEAELCEKLRDLGFDEQVTNTVIERVKAMGLIGDEQFSKMWVENRSTFRPRSQRLLGIELRRKGVAEEVIRQALSESNDDQTLAYQAARQRIRRLEGLDWDQFRNKLGAYLARRGFSYETIRPVVQRAWAEMQGIDSDHISYEVED